MEELERTLDRLFLRKKVEKGLAQILELDQQLAFPSRSFRSVHVAGTNGKGTVALNIANALTRAGLKTGLFISPHVHTITERIQIDGEMISKKELDRLLSLVMEMSKDLHFFGVLTLAAFQYFREKDVDFAVIEAGVGGALDPTNIIYPKLSLITNISDDHKDLLGGSMADIARAKAGIIKEGITSIVGHRAAHSEVLKRAFFVRSPLIALPPRKDFREENQLMVQQALKELSRGAALDYKECHTSLPCRFEEGLFFEMPVVFDIAHNSDGLEKLFERLREHYPDRPFFTIFNMSHGEYIKECTSILKANAEKVFLYEFHHPRLVAIDLLKNYFMHSDTEILDDFLEEARRQSAVLVVTGSAFIMHDVKKALHMRSEPALTC